MGEQAQLAGMALHVLAQSHTVTQCNLGAEAHLSKRGITLDTEAWDVEGLGRLCAMHMIAPLGLMRMETLIIAPTAIDMPLMNLDWVAVFGKEMQMMELYNIQLNPWPEEDQEVFHLIKQRDADLADTEQDEERWYDDLLYDCSYHKRAGRHEAQRLLDASQDFLVAYADLCLQAVPCDKNAKSEKVRVFAERLFAEGGPAVSMVTQLFGVDVARRLIIEHMYGVKGT